MNRYSQQNRLYETRLLLIAPSVKPLKFWMYVKLIITIEAYNLPYGH